MIEKVKRYKQILRLFTSDERIDTDWQVINDNRVDYEALEKIEEVKKVNILV